MNWILSTWLASESSTLGGFLPMTLFEPSPLMERVARMLCMGVELLVPLGAVGMVFRMLA